MMFSRKPLETTLGRLDQKSPASHLAVLRGLGSYISRRVMLQKLGVTYRVASCYKSSHCRTELLSLEIPDPRSKDSECQAPNQNRINSSCHNRFRPFQGVSGALLHHAAETEDQRCERDRLEVAEDAHRCGDGLVAQFRLCKRVKVFVDQFCCCGEG